MCPLGVLPEAEQNQDGARMAVDPIRAIQMAGQKWIEDAIDALQKNREEVTLGVETVIINRRIEYIEPSLKRRVRPMAG